MQDEAGIRRSEALDREIRQLDVRRGSELRDLEGPGGRGDDDQPGAVLEDPDAA
jgi:hypothetical protein